nr:MAG TPA: hypothetical protein [Caudoviricetes sp.]
MLTLYSALYRQCFRMYYHLSINTLVNLARDLSLDKDR